MSYTAYLAYEGGAKSHKITTSSRTEITELLLLIAGDSELMALGERVVVLHHGKEILNVLSKTVTEDIKDLVKWPQSGAPVKVNHPVSATVYLPSEVRDWLRSQGNGKVSAGLRKLIESAKIPELENAWRNN